MQRQNIRGPMLITTFYFCFPTVQYFVNKQKSQLSAFILPFLRGHFLIFYYHLLFGYKGDVKVKPFYIFKNLGIKIQ
jgi:hypothetical protein